MKIPKYRRHSRKDVGFVEIRGRRIYFAGRYNSTESKAAYARILAQVLSNQEPSPVPRSGATVADLVERYEIYAKEYYKANKEFGCLCNACDVLLEVSSARRVADFGPADLEAVRDAMVERGWVRNTVNHAVSRLRRVFKWGLRKGICPPWLVESLRAIEPLRAGRTQAPDRPEVTPPPPGAVERTIPFLPPIVHDMVQVQRLTGMRADNLCAMRPCDIDTRLDIWLYRPPEHKTAWAGVILTIPIGPKAQAILKPYLDRPAESYLFSPKESMDRRFAKMRAKRKTPVQPSQMYRRVESPIKAPRDRYDSSSYGHAITAAIRQANEAEKKLAAKKRRQPVPIPHWTSHQLRHAIATEVRDRYGLEAAQVMLGHTHAKMTEHYAQRNLLKAVAVAQEIG